jgi:glycolate oxidase
MGRSEAELVEELGRLLSPAQAAGGAAIRRSYDADAYGVDRSEPSVVAFPETTEEAARVVRWCHATGTPFTPRGAGTGLSGGAMPALGGVVISTKRMTQILKLDIPNRMAHAQAGAVNLKLSQAAAPHGLHFAPDPSSQSVSTIGGNIAENSGGPHTLKYGVTAQHVLQATVVAFDGEVFSLGGLCPGGPGIDLLPLMVGSEGTLGLVTEAWVRLTPLPESVETVLAAFTDSASATRAVAAIIAQGVIPAALEMMDHGIMGAVREAFGLQYPEGARALLLIECDGLPHQAAEEIEAAEAACRQEGSIEIRRAGSAQERAQLWTARKKGVGALGRLAPTLVTHDGVIPRSRLPEMLEEVYAAAAEAGVHVANIFHAGDGNLHPIFCFDEREPGRIEAVVAAGERIIRRCIEMGGSVSGEHGIGVEKSGLLALMFDEESMRLQKDLKAVFHQSDLCNPCKIMPDQKGCVEHMRRWRGAAT